ncbi:MAG: LuxR C-terminal-related transcriptional regulator [Steroidobacteraceae bacterium]
MIAPFTDDGATQALDSSGILPLPIADSRTRSSDGTWAIRRAIIRARSALLRMRLDEAAKAITRLNRLLSNRPHSDQVLYSRALRILQACRLAAGDDFAAARSALATLPALRGDIVSATILRYVDWKSGAREQACAPEGFDYLAAPARGQAIYKLLNLCMSAAMAFERLHLTVSATLAAEALRFAQEHYGKNCPMSCLPATLLAQVAYEQGRFEEAEALLAPRLQVIRAAGLPECIVRTTVLLARLAFHRGRHRAALTILREAEALGRVRRWPRVVSVASSEYARALLLRRYDEAPSSERVSPHIKGPWMPPEGLSSGQTPHFSTVAGTLARLASAASAASGGSGNDYYELLISCLRIGAGHGLRMVFVDAGQPILALLKSLYCALPGSDTQTSDLRAYIATILKVTAPVANANATPPTYRHLSERETGILKLIAHGMSNKRIALSLGITPETVKTHAKSIFVKLATRTRAQAVARAEGIGLLL